jgi:hypothetical protein
MIKKIISAGQTGAALARIKKIGSGHLMRSQTIYQAASRFANTH